MNTLVLAAGKSTRIAGVSGGRPKPLLEIDGRPVIERTLAWLASHGIRDVWINLHHRPEDIRNALGDGSRLGVRINYVVEPEILGTAGAYGNVAKQWASDDTTLVVYGDNLMAFDLDAFVAAHRAGGADATIALFDPDRHANSRIAGGRVTLDDAGFVASFLEGHPERSGSHPERSEGSAPSHVNDVQIPRFARNDMGSARNDNYVNAGAYLLEPSVPAEIPAGFSDFARDIFPALASERRLRGWVMEPAGYCIGLDTPESLRVAESLVSTRQVVLA